jgi:hypothetical protein
MNNILKKINVLAFTAMLIGGGFAFATQSNYQSPNMKYSLENQRWEPIPLGVSYICEDAPSDCVGYSPDLTTPALETIEKGAFTVLP